MNNLTFDSFDIVADYAIRGSRRRPGRAIDPEIRFVVAHDTGNPGASARAHAKWYRNDPNPPLDKISSAHIFVDHREIVETIPIFTGPPEQALHVLYNRPLDNQLYGFDANRAAVGIELCYGGSIDAGEAYRRYAWTIAKTCRTFGLDPSRHVVGHQVLDPGRKDDPGQSLRQFGRSYEGLLRDVVDIYRECLRSEGTQDDGAIGSGLIKAGEAETTVNLAVRDEPRRLGKSDHYMKPGTQVTITEVMRGEMVHGNDIWCRIGEGKYCWSGGLKQI